jgi:hypothetical protein
MTAKPALQSLVQSAANGNKEPKVLEAALRTKVSCERLVWRSGALALWRSGALAVGSLGQLCCVSSRTPREELVDSSDLMVGDTSAYLGEDDIVRYENIYDRPEAA